MQKIIMSRFYLIKLVLLILILFPSIVMTINTTEDYMNYGDAISKSNAMIGKIDLIHNLETEINNNSSNQSAVILQDTQLNTLTLDIEELIILNSKILEITETREINHENMDDIIEKASNLITLINNNSEYEGQMILLKENIKKLVSSYEDAMEITRYWQMFLAILDFILFIVLILLMLIQLKIVINKFEHSHFGYIRGPKNLFRLELNIKRRRNDFIFIKFKNLSRFREKNGYDTTNSIANNIYKEFHKGLIKNKVWVYYFEDYFVIECKEDTQKILKFIKKTLDVTVSDNEGHDHKLTYAAVVVEKKIKPESLKEIVLIVEDLIKSSSKKVICYKDKELFLRRRELMRFINKETIKSNLVTYIQPIYQHKNKEINSIEFLSRFEMKGEIISPNEFLPVVIRKHLSVTMDETLIKRAEEFYFSLNKEQQDKIVLSVNISLKGLLSNTNQGIFKAIRKLKMPREKLTCELLENIVIDNSNINRIKLLKELGVNVAIDDFSMGNTSIKSLYYQEISIIKLDKTLVDEVIGNEYAFKLLKELTNMLSALGKKVIIEGVESKEQLEAVNKIGIKYVQGYYFSKPFPIEDFKS